MILADQQIPDDATVTPGIEGFMVFALLAVIVLLLVLSMSKHLRRIDKRAAEEAADAEDAAREAAARSTADDGAPVSTTPADVPPDSSETGREGP